MNIYDEIKLKIRLSSVIGKKVLLIRKGNNYLGLCPFHQEKTPSFNVNDKEGFYYCFGCQASGDAFTFLEKCEGYSHPEALKILANEAGIVLSNSSNLSFQEQYSILHKAAVYYHQQLLNNQKVLEYLHKERNISEDSIKKFYLGLSVNNADLLSQLKSQHSIEEIIQSGLFCKCSHSHSDLYAFFNQRIMFPIFNKKGHVIAFGGRTISSLKDNNDLKKIVKAKYLNSLESKIFQKKNTLFNLNNICFSPQKVPLFIVEGYIDVIALSQIGIMAVALLGTTISEYHFQEICKLTNDSVLCFDGDLAGYRAAIISAQKILVYIKKGQTISFMFLPPNKDPDDFIKQLPPEQAKIQWYSLYNQKLALGEFLWQYIQVEFLDDKDTPECKGMALAYVEKLISTMQDSSLKQYYFYFLKGKISYFHIQKFTRSHQKLQKNHLSLDSRDNLVLQGIKELKQSKKNDRAKFVSGMDVRHDVDIDHDRVDCLDQNLVLCKQLQKLELQIVAMLIYYPDLVDLNLELLSNLRLRNPLLSQLLKLLIEYYLILMDANTNTIKIGYTEILTWLSKLCLQADIDPELVKIVSHLTSVQFQQTYVWARTESVMLNRDIFQDWNELMILYEKQYKKLDKFQEIKNIKNKDWQIISGIIKDHTQK